MTDNKYYDQKKKDKRTNYYSQNTTHKIKNRATRTDEDSVYNALDILFLKEKSCLQIIFYLKKKN